MAALTASSFASRTSHVDYGAYFGSDSKAASYKIWFMKQNMTHYGLRASSNKVDDQLKINTKSRLAPRQRRRRRRRYESENGRSSGLIVCGSGMVLVFVGTEVGPWSKTGGLGDVLGGLPPAMAVNF